MPPLRNKKCLLKRWKHTKSSVMKERSRTRDFKTHGTPWTRSKSSMVLPRTRPKSLISLSQLFQMKLKVRNPSKPMSKRFPWQLLLSRTSSIRSMTQIYVLSKLASRNSFPSLVRTPPKVRVLPKEKEVQLRKQSQSMVRQNLIWLLSCILVQPKHSKDASLQLFNQQRRLLKKVPKDLNHQLKRRKLVKQSSFKSMKSVIAMCSLRSPWARLLTQPSLLTSSQKLPTSLRMPFQTFQTGSQMSKMPSRITKQLSTVLSMRSKSSTLECFKRRKRAVIRQKAQESLPPLNHKEVLSAPNESKEKPEEKNSSSNSTALGNSHTLDKNWRRLSSVWQLRNTTSRLTTRVFPLNSKKKNSKLSYTLSCKSRWNFSSIWPSTALWKTVAKLCTTIWSPAKNRLKMKHKRSWTETTQRLNQRSS